MSSGLTIYRTYIQRWAKKWFLGCEDFLPGVAWLLLSKTGPLFMYNGDVNSFKNVEKP